MPNPIACGRHDDGRPTLTGQLPRPMGFVHRKPQQRRFPQALARQGATTPGMPRLRPHTGPTQGGAFFVCLNSSLPRHLAHCPLRQLPVRNAQGSRCISHPTHFIGGLVHVRITFVLQYLPSGLPTGSKTDASFEALVSPEHHALALTGSRLCELAPTLTIEFQDNAVRRFAWRPEDGRLDLHPAAAMPAQP